MSHLDDDAGSSPAKHAQIKVTGGARVSKEKLLLAKQMRKEPTEGERVLFLAVIFWEIAAWGLGFLH